MEKKEAYTEDASESDEISYIEDCTLDVDMLVLDELLWGTINSPHLEHFTKVGALIFQFALLLSLLAFEDLFFGQIDIEIKYKYCKVYIIKIKYYCAVCLFTYGKK